MGNVIGSLINDRYTLNDLFFLILKISIIFPTLLHILLLLPPFRKLCLTTSEINHLQTHQVDENTIKPGDHIYTWTPFDLYSHHGIFIGENKVIHFTGDEDGVSASDPVPHPNCGCKVRQRGSGVISSCLKCFRYGSRSLYRYQYGVGVFAHLFKIRGGTCTIAESDPPEEVVTRAERLLQKGFGTYSVVGNNCEDFAFYCKTSLYGSEYGGGSQINSWLKSPLFVIFYSIVIGFMCSSPRLAAFAAPGIHWTFRNVLDIALRSNSVLSKKFWSSGKVFEFAALDDAVKTNVEDLPLSKTNI